MKILVIITRLALGALMAVSGLNKFLHFMELPPHEGDAAEFLRILGTGGYMDVIGGLEVLGGFLLLTGFFVPLGLVLLIPVIVNILLFHGYLGDAPDMISLASAGLALFVVIGYWSSFKRLLRPLPRTPVE